jgi:hypothetical protein
MIKKNCHIILFNLLCCFVLKAQYNTEFINYDNTKRSVSVNLDFDAGSNGISSSLSNKLIWGGYVDESIKEESSKHLKQLNNFGINLNYDVSTFIKGNNKFDFLIGFKNQEVLNASYTKDFFNLMFYGNSKYKGQTADLSNCNINALRFQEVKFGAILHRVDSVGKIGVSLSFLKGEQLFYLKTNKNSNLYTAIDGSELVFNSNFNLAISDTNNKKLAGFNGIGASADIFFETSYKSKIGKRSVLIANANNIGFLHWLNNSVQYSSDSSIRFSGYNINNILDLKDSTLNRITKDTLLNGLANARRENFNTNIPTNLVIINKIYFGKDELVCMQTGFRYIFNANYTPYFFLEPEYKYKNVTFGLHTGYGGYVRLNVGANITWNSKNWFLRLGSHSLQGYVFPKSSSGQGLFFSFAKKFK